MGFSLRYRIKTKCGAHFAIYSVATRGYFRGGGGVVWSIKLTTHVHLLPKLRMHGAVVYLRFSYIFMTWRLIKQRDSFTFTFRFTLTFTVSLIIYPD
jgi:hypothetical protein